VTRSLLSLLVPVAMSLSAAPTRAAPVPDAADRGAQLFEGRQPFAKRGPACVACHSVGGLPFPNGGTLGPDLTHVTRRMGAQGVQVALATLYFPAMLPLYRTKPLTQAEQEDLAAFFERADARPPPSHTWQVAALAGLIFVAFMLITGWAGRKRLRGVRRQLVANARAAAAKHAAARGETS
jgi:hypothetical protein